MDTINLNFDGYYVSIEGVPSRSGVYCVYRGIQNKEKNTVTLNQLLYIGQATDANDRLSDHEKESEWKKELKYGEIAIFTFAPIVLDKDRAEAAMISKHRPPLNSEFRYSFPFRTVQMSLSGCTALLSTSFIARDTRTGRGLGY